MKKCFSSIVPIQKGDKFSLMQCSKNELEYKQMKQIPYTFIVGSLMYAQTYTKPDISLLLGCLVDIKTIQEWITEKLQRKY